LTFSPKGMSFDQYFDLNDSMSESEQLIAFAVGCTPSPVHLAYLDLRKFFRPGTRQGGSVSLACQMASGIVATEVARVILGWPGCRPAPHYAQFDARRQQF